MRHYLYFLIFLQLNTVSCSYSQQNKNKIAKEKDTTIVYDLLKQTDSEFILDKKEVDKNETQGKFYEKKYFINSNIVKVEQYDKKGNLFDHTYSQAIVIYEYDANNRKAKMKLLDKNKRPIEDGFGGYWAIEYSYDEKGRIIKEIAKDTLDNIVKFIPQIDMRPPIVKYSYDKSKTHIKEFDETEKLIKEYDCEKIEECRPFK